MLHDFQALRARLPSLSPLGTFLKGPSRHTNPIVFGVRIGAFLGLLLAACWRPEGGLIPAAFAILALVVLDRRGLTVAAAVGLVTLLYHWEGAALLFGVFGYSLFFYSLIGLRSKRAAIVGFGFGAGLVTLNLRWLVAEFDARWAGLVLFIVSLYGGLFMAAVASLLRHSLVRRPGVVGIALTVLAFPAADYLRIATPRLGTSNLYSAHLVVANLDIAQAAHWVGAGGLSALMAFCSYAAASWLAHERRTRWPPRIAARKAARRRTGIAVALVILTVAAGKLDRLRSGASTSSTLLKIAVIQSGLPSEVHGYPVSSSRQTEPTKEGLPSETGRAQEPSLAPSGTRQEPESRTESAKEGLPSQSHESQESDPENYATSLRSYLRSDKPCDILFLPEGAISIGEWNDPNDPNAEPLMTLSDLENKFADQINSFLVTGAMIKEEINNKVAFRNTAVSLDSYFNLLGQIDKQFGAPLVEVNPFQGIPILEDIGERATHLSRQMRPKQNRAVLPIGSAVRAVVAICNEHQLPDIWSRRGVTDLSSVNLQLVLSDVSWFDNSDEERDQSRLARRLLAAKYRLPLLYVASGGSELWNRQGTLVHALDTQTQFGVWNLSVPLLDAARTSWQPPSEWWPVVLFCVLFAWRVYRSKLVGRGSRKAARFTGAT
jgi:apolipoprotein N-acyltransferase